MTSQIDLEEVTDRAHQHNLMWRSYKRWSHWEPAIEKLVAVHDLVAGSGKCFTRVALAAGVLFGLITGGKAAFDVLVQFFGTN